MKESKALPSRKIILFGSNGLLGKALARHLSVHPILWSEVGHLDQKDLNSWAIDRFGRGDGAFDIVFANGVTNPRLPPSEIRESNLLFPRRVVEAFSGWNDTRFMTFGSIMENFPLLCETNAYLLSKLELSSWIQGQAKKTSGLCKFLHIRLHTLYGKGMQRHMFLGQLAEALKSNRVFEMSQGDQLREYHHVDDIAQSLRTLLSREWDFAPVMEISSGKPVALGEVARFVFRTLKKEELLKVGKLARPSHENTHVTFSRSPNWLLTLDRDPFQGIVDTITQEIEKN